MMATFQHTGGRGGGRNGGASARAPSVWDDAGGEQDSSEIAAQVSLHCPLQPPPSHTSPLSTVWLSLHRPRKIS
jgi:streptomycin 6-kinase